MRTMLEVSVSTHKSFSTEDIDGMDNLNAQT